MDGNNPKVKNNQGTNSILAKLDTQNSQSHKAVEVGTIICKQIQHPVLKERKEIQTNKNIISLNIIMLANSGV